MGAVRLEGLLRRHALALGSVSLGWALVLVLELEVAWVGPLSNPWTETTTSPTAVAVTVVAAVAEMWKQ